jgi:hypothetical protein
MLLVLLRWTWLHSKVKGSSSHSNLAHTQALARIKLRISSSKGWGEILKSWERVVFAGVSSIEQKRWRGIYRQAPKISRYYAVYVFIGTSDTIKTHGREYFVGNNVGHPRGGGSELPTLGRNFRPTKIRWPRTPCRRKHMTSEGVGTSDPYRKTGIVWWSECMVSLNGLFASPRHLFTSPL